MYTIEITVNKSIFGEMFQIEREVSVFCTEDEMRELNLIQKMTRSQMIINVCIEISDEEGNLCGRIETDYLGNVTLYVYFKGRYKADVIKLWDWSEKHKLTAVEVRNIIHSKIF